MNTAKALLKASLGITSFLKIPIVEAQPRPASATPIMVPIRSIGPREKGRIENHLLALDAQDRYLRFGYAASDEQVRRYVEGLDFERDVLFGIYNRRLDLIAMAHLAFAPADQPSDCAEFGVSVSKHARGRGYGARLFERAVVAARNEGVGMLFIHALSENAAMLRIARKAGAKVVRTGSEAEAHLRLPSATFDSRMSEIALQQFAQLDYHLKTRAKQFWAFLEALQEIRSGVRSARDHSSP
ncbi:GCN5 family acetyltransferase [Burkholderiales bacterium 8X]|nr:GCN5 family acetyltransferase [Burkholderiales bacterium 8X]